MAASDNKNASGRDQWDDIQRRMDRAKKFASWMDDTFAIPGTKIRFGLDSLIGLLPGVGDVATAAAGVWMIVEAVRLRIPLGVLIRMLINLLVDLIGGTIPIVGDLFDLWWKSNRRNADLMQRYLQSQSQQTANLESSGPE